MNGKNDNCTLYVLYSNKNLKIIFKGLERTHKKKKLWSLFELKGIENNLDENALLSKSLSHSFLLKLKKIARKKNYRISQTQEMLVSNRMESHFKIITFFEIMLYLFWAVTHLSVNNGLFNSAIVIYFVT